jgi:hypothetical protein
MYSFQEVLEALQTPHLASALSKLESFAKAQGIEELSQWSLDELEGYEDKSRENLPGYRKKVFVKWIDFDGGRFSISNPEYSFLNYLPILNGVEELEQYSTNGLIMQPLGALNALSERAGVQIYGASVEPQKVRALLGRIRSEAIRTLQATFPNSSAFRFPYPVPDFTTLVSDPELANILRLRWEEANQSFQAGAYLSTIIMLGSILEGVLLAKVEQNPTEARGATNAPRDRRGNLRSFDTWRLVDLITVAHECGWLGSEVRDFSNALRNYRNLVHPNEQRSQNSSLDVGTCRVSWEVVRAALDDLSK